MKKFMFSAVCLTMIIAAASCDKDSSRESKWDGEESEKHLVSLSVAVSMNATRATEISDISEEAVKSLQIFLFGENDGLEKYGSVENSKSLEISCFAGKKDVVALVNGPEIDWLSICTRKDLDTKISVLLEDNSEESFLMYGSASEEVSEDTAISVDVSRRVARVMLKQIINNVDSNSSVGELSVDAVYLINVAGSTTYLDDPLHSPTIWYNQSSWDNTMEPLFYDYVGGEVIAYGGSYSTVHRFYCYPNPTTEDSTDPSWSERFTRLVVQATLNGNTWYYPITLEGVQANCSYEIDLTITGSGSDSPDKEPINYEYGFVVNVKEWDHMELEETI